MAKRSEPGQKDNTPVVDVSAVLRGDRSGLTGLETPPQVIGAMSGWHGFTGHPTRIVGFHQHDETGKRVLVVEMDPHLSSKHDHRRFSETLAAGPVVLAKDGKDSWLSHHSGDEDFYHACCASTPCASTLDTLSRYTDIVAFVVPNNGKKPKVSERAYPRAASRNPRSRGA